MKIHEAIEIPKISWKDIGKLRQVALETCVWNARTHVDYNPCLYDGGKSAIAACGQVRQWPIMKSQLRRHNLHQHMEIVRETRDSYCGNRSPHGEFRTNVKLLVGGEINIGDK